MKKYLKNIAKNFFYKLPSMYVLMFHHIDNGKIEYKSGCILEYKKFIEILDSGIEFISLNEYLKFNNIKNNNKCTITFDDGLEDVYSVAYPELKKRNIPFTIFVVTDFLDNEGYITTNQLIELANDNLVTIGSHGITHKNLSSLDYDTQKNEIILSKNILENIIKKPVVTFAYSHGQYDDNTISIMQETRCYGFCFGVCGFPTNIFTKRWKYYLPRINCTNDKIPFIVERNKNNLRIKFD